MSAVSFDWPRTCVGDARETEVRPGVSLRALGVAQDFAEAADWFRLRLPVQIGRPVVHQAAPTLEGMCCN